MSRAFNGILSYISIGSSNKSNTEKEKELGKEPSSPLKNESCEPLINEDCDSGYLKKAMTGVSSGVYTVGAAGFSSVKWIAGTTYNVTTGVVGSAASAAGAVVTSVTKGTPKEHSD